jgi:hypothetical protein
MATETHADEHLTREELEIRKQIRQDANKAVGLALWSYVGLVIPLVGWILAGYSRALVRDLPPDSGVVGRRVRTARFHSSVSVLLSILVILAWYGVYSLGMSELQKQETARQQQQQQAAQTQQLQQQAKQNALNSCLAQTDADYWNYVRLNASSSKPGANGSTVYYAPQTVWDSAEGARTKAKDECYRRASFQ